MDGKPAEEPEIPETGAVFTFGKSKFADNAPSKFWIKKDEIVHISCGDEHTAVVTDSGRLFTFGSNEWGQLGLGHNNNTSRPSCVKVLKPNRVVAVACGRHHTIVALESGALMAVGSNNEGQLGVGRNPEWTSVPMPVSGVEGTIKKLSAGTNHSACLTTDGDIYIWGSNTEGQLGVGEDGEENIFKPTKLNLDLNAIDLSCGYYHSALVTESGDVYTWGEGEGGKLGLAGASGDTDLPRQVNLPEKVVSVSCGGTHTVVLTQSGRMYSWGQSTHGQLGLGTRILESSTPHPITALSTVSVASISTGENHSACVSSSGNLYTWGDGRHGKLCHDVETTTNNFSPVYVARFKGFKVTRVVCGGCHTMVHGIPGHDTILDEEDLKINGSINEEVNLEARERRRSGLSTSTREDIKAPLPPIKISPTKRVEDIETFEEESVEEEQDDKVEKEDIKDDSSNEEEDNKEEKQEGKIKKFFNGLLKRRKSSDEEEDTPNNEDEKAGNKSEIDDTDSEENDKDDKSKIESDEDSDQEETAKCGKKVSFFSKFSKSSDDKADKSAEDKDSVKDEGKNGRGFKSFFTRSKPENDEHEEDNITENGVEEDSKLSIEDAEDDGTESGEDSLTSSLKPKPRKLIEKSKPESFNGTSDQSNSTTVKSKSCSIL